ncbi:MAG: hypothetical protein ACE5HI_14800, partial [bacterium]
LIRVISNPDDFYRDEKSDFVENLESTDISPEILRGVFGQTLIIPSVGLFLSVGFSWDSWLKI